MLRKDFDFLRNSRPNVPMYADGRELLVFRTFLQSVSVSKRVFRHAEATRRGAAGGFLHYSAVPRKRIRRAASWARVAGACGNR